MLGTLKNPALTKIYVVPLISMVTSSMVGAIAILYALDLGADILQVNLISTVESTMSILLLVPFGMLADRFGRKPMLLYPRIAMSLGIIARAFATEPNHLLLAALVGGFAGADFFPVLVTMVTDVAKPGEQREAISTLYLFSGIGMLLGPLIGSLLLTMPQVTLRNLYQIHLIAEVGGITYMAYMVRETRPETEKDVKIDYRSHVTSLLASNSFRGILAMGFLFYFTFAILNTYIPIYGRVNLGLSDAEISSFSFYQNVAITLIRFSFATFLRSASTRLFLILTLTSGGISSLVAPLASNYLSVVLIRLASGMAHGSVAILGASLVAAESEASNRGAAQSLYNMSHGIGNITKVVTSSIAETLGLAPVFILGGLTALSSTIPIILRRPPQRAAD